MPITQERTKRANAIIKRADDMFKVKETHSRNWPAYEQIYQMFEQKRTGEDAWRADQPETWTFATIKTAQATFVDSRVKLIVTRHEDDPKTKAKDVEDLYSDVAEKGNLNLELYYARLDAFRVGNGFTKTVYVKDKRKVWEIKKFDPKTEEFTWKEKTINEFDDPKTIRVSPYLILKDDLARADWNTCRDLIELEVMGRDAAEEKYGHLLNFDKDVPQTTKLLAQLTSGAKFAVIAETDGTGLRNTEFQTLSKYHFFSPGFEWSDDVVEIMHYWNKGVLTPSGALDSYEILINGIPAKIDTKNKPSPNPYIHKQLPYTHYMYSPISGDIAWGMGIVEIGKSPGQAIKKNQEMMIDRQRISIFAPAFSDVNDEIDQKNIKMKPLSIIRTKGGVPKVMTIPGVTTGDLAVMDRIEQDYKRATGIDERILGIQSDLKSITATEASFLREAALKRLGEFLFLFKSALLHGEIKLKLSLFKQYFSNPMVREKYQKRDKAMRQMKNKFKEFKIKTGNTYTMKEISPNYFEGEIDADLDVQLLLPLTQAQRVTMWGQLIRDSVPAIQAGVIDWSLKKMYDGYAEALGRNPDSLKEDSAAMSIQFAEVEHKLFANDNTSGKMGDVLPNGTDKSLLSADHLLKHNELLDSDVQLEDKNRLRLLDHIGLDVKNFQAKQSEQTKPQQIQPQAIAGVGGITPQAAGVPTPPPPVETPEEITPTV